MKSETLTSLLIVGLSVLSAIQSWKILQLTKKQNYLASQLVKVWVSLKDLAKMNLDNSVAINHNADLNNEINRLIVNKVHDIDNSSRTKGD
jgi:flagellar biosynthesis/type III secretory pathway chaperone